MSFYISSSNYLYYIFILLFTLFTFYIFKKNIVNQKNFEIISAYYLFFSLLLYYTLANNLLTLVFIFEFQSLIIIYIISNSFYLKNNSYLNFKKLNNYPIWYFNSLIYQFWTSFFSAILLTISLLIFFKNFFFIDWINLEIYVYMLNLKFFKFNRIEILIYFTPLIFGFILKLGLLPFFFWKPEIYKNFNLELLFLYTTFYMFSLVYLIIFFFFNYFFLINYIFIYFYYPIIIITLIFLPFLFYIITEIRMFIAYSSLFHIVLILISTVLNERYIHLSFLYLFTYLFYITFFMLLLFYLSNFNIWYLSDIQYFYNDQSINNIIINIFLGMAGLPPFLGFFSKISVIANLYFDKNYFLCILFLISSLIISFFYIQNSRFFGYSLKKTKYFKNNLVLIINYNYSAVILLFLIFNTLNWLFLTSLLNFSYIIFLN